MLCLWRVSLISVILLSCIFSSKAYCYLDPGTGSFIFQVLITALLSVIFAIKVFWNRIKLFVSKFILKLYNK